MTSIIHPHDAIFANYHSLLSLPVIRSLQEENDQLRRENARLRNVLLTSFEKQVAIADPEVRFRRNTEQSVVWKSDSVALESVLPFGLVPSGSVGRLSERLPTVQRTIPNPIANEVANTVLSTPVLSSAKADLLTPVLDPALEYLQRVYIKTEKMQAPVIKTDASVSQVSVKEKEVSPPTPFVVVSDEEEEGSVHFQDSVVEMPSVVQEETVAAIVQPTEAVIEEESEQVIEDDDGEALQEVVIGGTNYYVEQLAQGADVYNDESETVGTLCIRNGFAVDASLPEVSGQDEELEPQEDIEGTTWFVDGLLNAYCALEDDEVGDYAGRWVQRVVYSLQGNKAKPDAEPTKAEPEAEDDDDVEEAEIDGVLYFVSNGGAEGCRVYARYSEEDVGELVGYVREGVLVVKM